MGDLGRVTVAAQDVAPSSAIGMLLGHVFTRALERLECLAQCNEMIMHIYDRARYAK